MKNTLKKEIEKLSLEERIELGNCLRYSVMLANAMEKTGMSLEEIAKNTKLERSHITRILNSTDDLTMATVAKLDTLLGSLSRMGN